MSNEIFRLVLEIARDMEIIAEEEEEVEELDFSELHLRCEHCDGVDGEHEEWCITLDDEENFDGE